MKKVMLTLLVIALAVPAFAADISIVDNGQTSTWYFYADYLQNLEKLLTIVSKINIVYRCVIF